jgi:hypothetical protein
LRIGTASTSNVGVRSFKRFERGKRFFSLQFLRKSNCNIGCDHENKNDSLNPIPETERDDSNSEKDDHHHVAELAKQNEERRWRRRLGQRVATVELLALFYVGLIESLLDI